MVLVWSLHGTFNISCSLIPTDKTGECQWCRCRWSIALLLSFDKVYHPCWRRPQDIVSTSKGHVSCTFQPHMRRDLLVFWIQNSFSSSLPLNGLHSCAVQTLLCLWPALVRGHRPLRHRTVAWVAPTPVPSSTDMVHVVDPQQQTIVHNFETLQELHDKRKKTTVASSLVNIAASFANNSAFSPPFQISTYCMVIKTYVFNLFATCFLL